jgi:hypothetical protein
VELEELGMDVLKGQLTRLGLKCGGTLAERAKRLFEVKKVGGRLFDLDPSLFAAGGGSGGGKGQKNKKKKHRDGGGDGEDWGTNDEGRRLVPQQGPLLPGHDRKKRKT